MDDALPAEGGGAVEQPGQQHRLSDPSRPREDLCGAGVEPAGVVEGEQPQVEASSLRSGADRSSGAVGEALVGVEDQHPALGHRGDGGVSGIGEVPLPGVVADLSPEAAGDGWGVVAAAGVDDDHAIHRWDRRAQAARDPLGLVSRDHAEGDHRGPDRPWEGRLKRICDPGDMLGLPLESLCLRSW